MVAGAAPLTGQCMCRRRTLEVSVPLLKALYCHCKRRTGSAFSVNALTEPGSLTVTQGTDSVRTYPTWRRRLAQELLRGVGGALFTANPENPELKGVRLGVLDGDPGIRPSAHQFVDYAPAWAPVSDDGLPRFPSASSCVGAGFSSPPRPAYDASVRALLLGHGLARARLGHLHLCKRRTVGHVNKLRTMTPPTGPAASIPMTVWLEPSNRVGSSSRSGPRAGGRSGT